MCIQMPVEAHKKDRYDPIFQDAQGRYVASLSINQRTKYVGAFDSKERAHAALTKNLKKYNIQLRQRVLYY